MITEWVDRFGVPLEEKLVLKSWDEYAVKVAEAYDARPGLELDPDEARAELLKRYTEMQDELIKKYKKGSRV